MYPLSVVITTHNGQNLIADCIKSVKFADQVIVIDNESTDNSSKIAKKLGAIVYPHKNDPNVLNKAKNFGFTKAKNSWILSLDTDERVDEKLADEIKKIVKAERSELNGYLIPRKNIIFGKWIEHGLWYPDFQLRLFRKGQGKFPEKHQHELLTVNGESAKLSGHIIHYNYQTISQYLQKIDRQYSGDEVKSLLDKGHRLLWHDALRFPLQDFLANYFARAGYKDGLHGLVLALLQAFYMFIVFCKLWEKQGFKPQDITLNDTQQEFNHFSPQLRYWFTQAKLSSASLPQKFIIRAKSKLRLKL